MRRWTTRTRVLLVTLAVLLALGWIGRDWLLARAYVYTLESGARVSGLQVDNVVETLAIEPGSRIADVGSGTGLFSRPLARAAGRDGVVYAVDINATLLAHVEETARDEGLEAIRTVLAAEDDPRIPEAVDLIFLCDTLHHIDNRGAYLKTLRRYLKAGGRVAVIDFTSQSSPHLSSARQYSLAELDEWMEAAGFDQVQRHDFLATNFFVVFECATCPDPSAL